MELALSIFQVLKSLGIWCNMKSLGIFFSRAYVLVYARARIVLPL